VRTPLPINCPMEWWPCPRSQGVLRQNFNSFVRYWSGYGSNCFTCSKLVYSTFNELSLRVCLVIFLKDACGKIGNSLTVVTFIETHRNARGLKSCCFSLLLFTRCGSFFWTLSFQLDQLVINNDKLLTSNYFRKSLRRCGSFLGFFIG
jgi:hypothetical protein